MVAANLLLWPGLGTILARRKSGLVQMGLSGGGLAMAMVGLVGFYSRWVSTTDFPGWRDRYLLAFLTGIGVFTMVWLWALVSSVQIIRSARPKDHRSGGIHPPPAMDV